MLPKFSSESTLIGAHGTFPMPPITARVRARCTQARMLSPWKPCEGGQGVPAPVGHQGTFSMVVRGAEKGRHSGRFDGAMESPSLADGKTPSAGTRYVLYISF
jgi:hypothetical protein